MRQAKKQGRPERQRRANRASALVVVVVLCAMMLVILLTTLTEANSSIVYAGLDQRQARVRYAAEAGMGYICDQISRPADAKQIFATQFQPTQYTTPYNGPTNNYLLYSRDQFSSPQNITNTLGNPVVGNPATVQWRPLFLTSPLTPTIQIPGDTAFGAGQPKSAVINVYVWLKDSGNAQGDDYTLAAYAEYPKSGFFGGTANANNNYGQSTIADRCHIQLSLRESQPASNFMFFTYGISTIYMTPITVNGSIHSNGDLVFPTVGTATVTGDATASGQIQNTPHGNVSGIMQSNAPTVGLPASSTTVAADDATIANNSVAPGAAVAGSGKIGGVSATPPAAGGTNNFYNITLGNVVNSSGTANGGDVWQGLGGANTQINADITIHNNTTPPTLDITASTPGTGNFYTYTNVPFPPKGVLYVSGDVVVRSADGTYTNSAPNVGLTIVAGGQQGGPGTGGNIMVDSNIQYKDSGGNMAFQTTDSSGAVITPPLNSNWTGLGYQYSPNPAYTGTNQLGLLANGSVFVADDLTWNSGAPSSVFLNCDTFASNGSSLDAVGYDGTDGIHPASNINLVKTGGAGLTNYPGSAYAAFQNGSYRPGYNLMVGGSLVGNDSVDRTDHCNGFANGTGLYCFDSKGSSSAPPGWPANQSPIYGAVEQKSPFTTPASFITVKAAGGGPSGADTTHYNGYGGP